MKQIAAIFDMDGTVLDTLEDLKCALNYAFEEAGHSHDFKREEVALFFGSAVHVAIQRGLAREAGMQMEELLQIGTKGHETVDGIDEAEVNRIQAIYKPYYEKHCNDNTAPYPGIVDMIRDLRKQGIRCAVVSNKPDPAVQSLVADLFPDTFDFSLGEIAGLKRKPAPDMVEKCLDAIGTKAEDAVYIGDSEIDIQTAENSGLPCISVDWGFRPVSYLSSHGAEVIVSTVADLGREIMRRREE